MKEWVAEHRTKRNESFDLYSKKYLMKNRMRLTQWQCDAEKGFRKWTSIGNLTISLPFAFLLFSIGQMHKTQTIQKRSQMADLFSMKN